MKNPGCDLHNTISNRNKRSKINFVVFKEGYQVKSNQVCATMEIQISDCQPTIAKKFLYCCKDLI
jgi:hypothetical protein